MTREQAFAAIFAKLSPLSTTFKTISRRLQLVETFDTAAMPALFQQQVNEPIAQKQYITDGGGLAYSVLNVSWYIYVAQADDSAAMTPPLNACLDAVINQVFDGNASNIVTVGSEMFALMPTAILYWEGVLGDRAVARIDVQAQPLNLP